MKPNSTKIIFDGECDICTNLKGFAETHTERENLNFIPFQSDQLADYAPKLSVDQASQTLHVITEQGHHIRGARAVFEIMSKLPGLWGWLGRILVKPPFYLIAEPFYRLFARYRYGFGVDVGIKSE